MSESMEMSVSSIVSKDGKKRIYVQFHDGARAAEITFPAGKVMSNEGFSEKEMAALIFYVQNNKEQILGAAKQINVVKAFMDSGKKESE